MATDFAIYLASASPRRAELLQQAGVSFERVVADIDETPLDSESPRDYVERLALAKAVAVQSLIASSGRPMRPVLGSDTCVVIDGQILGKPVDQADATAMLTRLSSSQHQVMTSVAVVDHRQQQALVSITDVTFRAISASEISAYWHSGEPADKAGSYGIQGKGGLFVEHLSGSYTGVVGLPLAETEFLLQQFGLSCW
ncbi:dTTP/UTP pyrophosphatase [Sinobacterium norvegicum]|uniref:dTTP/UTP pyrophosphatase n=1 Tax=Sinobacterium norvegicum TaxID=1641715 RepID=A0ABM9ACY9_9GAMM|nr:Maf family protein [Sinobacterium norvegicum]CAH0991066.1 dTTP/UTP pyrophosphatase [Sinobacterium norvegicum]